MHMSKQFLLWVGIFVVTVAVIIGLAVASQKKGGEGKSTQSDSLTVEVSGMDHVKGNPMSKLILVEYSDFQCPACGVYYPLVKKLGEEYGNRIQIAYRNFPLTQLHKHAYRAAQAAESAGKQGKFFEMHDLLFERQSEWSELPDVNDRFAAFADELKLNKEQFKRDLDSKEVRDKIDADMKSGQSSGVQGTPTFYLNGVKIDNPRSYDEFKQVIATTLEGGSNP